MDERQREVSDIASQVMVIIEGRSMRYASVALAMVLGDIIARVSNSEIDALEGANLLLDGIRDQIKTQYAAGKSLQ